MNLSALSRDTLVGRLARWPLQLLPEDLILPILQGPARGFRWIVEASNHGCWLGSYEYRKRQSFEEVVQPGDVVYDVGAHVGYYSLVASALVGDAGQVIAFEPFPRNLKYLRHHLVLNDISNVRVVEVAVSAVNGTANFAAGDSFSQGSLIQSRAGIEVRTVTLNRVIKEGMPRPDVIKIDVEGAEALVLEGATILLEENAPVVFLATHGPGVHAACCELLRQHNYTLDAIEDETIERASELIARPG